MASRTAGLVAHLPVPQFMRSTLYSWFASSYNVNLTEIVDPIDSFPRFVDFFTRRIHPREVDQSPNVLVSPADSRVLSFTEVKGNDVLLVKNINYDLIEFVTGRKQGTDEMVKRYLSDPEKNSLYSIIFYLSPGDYHRYHSSVDFQVLERTHIAGHLWPVKVDYVASKKVILIRLSPRVCMRTTKELLCLEDGAREISQPSSLERPTWVR